MAKKNLQSLMSGILGESTAVQSTTTVDPEPQYAPTVLEQAVAQLDAEDNPARHEPEKRKSKQRETKQEKSIETNPETRATFFIEDDLLRKLRYIALMDTITQKDIINNSLRKYVNDWERKNEIIPLPRK